MRDSELVGAKIFNETSLACKGERNQMRRRRPALRTTAMNYVVSLSMGLLVGVIYALCKVRSPAPPIIALIGLFGIVLGEAGVAYLRTIYHPVAQARATVNSGCNNRGINP